MRFLNVLAAIAFVLAASAGYHNSRRIGDLERAIVDLRTEVPRSDSLIKSLGAPPAEPMTMAVESTKGSDRAPLGMIVYSDFQCPYCGRFVQDVLPRIDQMFISTGRLRFSFRHLPLENHTEARAAAEAAECAARQGQFWAMHNRLFQDGVGISGPRFDLQARLIGLDVDRFDACMHGEARVKVQGDLDEARRLGITGTPTFLIGDAQADGRYLMRKSIVGTQTYQVFDRVITNMLSTR